ncbi:MAG: hypothetical protein IIA59_06950 [Candidatus Marinimicrobia bacterium]|nr:hypothetical protein [Candidatus Neomarinimicrobiota bacterium]
MNIPKFQKVVICGVAGTFAMTAIMLFGPVVGMPKMDMGEMLGTMNPIMELPYSLGWMLHFVIGIILAYIYAAFLYDKLPFEGWTRGAIYSLIPFMVMQAVLGPMMGMGFFSGGDMMAIVASLIQHLVYGGVMGLVFDYGDNPVVAAGVVEDASSSEL